MKIIPLLRRLYEIDLYPKEIIRSAFGYWKKYYETLFDNKMGMESYLIESRIDKYVNWEEFGDYLDENDNEY